MQPADFLTNNPVPSHPDGRRPVVTSSFGPRSSGMHFGNDILYAYKDEPDSKPWSVKKKFAMPDASIGVPVPALAAGPGIVEAASMTPTGFRVRIDHGDGWSTGYFHLSNLAVKLGQKVKGGTPVGNIAFDPRKGTGGLNHLHFQLSRGGGANANAVDPEKFLGNQLSALPTLPYPKGDFLIKLMLAGFIAWGGYRLLQ